MATIKEQIEAKIADLDRIKGEITETFLQTASISQLKLKLTELQQAKDFITQHNDKTDLVTDSALSRK
jgi:hypothetical protein